MQGEKCENWRGYRAEFAGNARVTKCKSYYGNRGHPKERSINAGQMLFCHSLGEGGRGEATTVCWYREGPSSSCLVRCA